MDQSPDERVAERARERAEELAAEEDLPGVQVEAQAEAMLADSDRRQEDRDAAPSSVVEHRSSEDTVPPLDLPS